MKAAIVILALLCAGCAEVNYYVTINHDVGDLNVEMTGGTEKPVTVNPLSDLQANTPFQGGTVSDPSQVINK